MACRGAGLRGHPRRQSDSAIEAFARPEPMKSYTKTIPRSGSVGVDVIPKGSAYGEDSGTTDEITITPASSARSSASRRRTSRTSSSTSSTRRRSRGRTPTPSPSTTPASPPRGGERHHGPVHCRSTRRSAPRTRRSVTRRTRTTSRPPAPARGHLRPAPAARQELRDSPVLRPGPGARSSRTRRSRTSSAASRTPREPRSSPTRRPAPTRRSSATTLKFSLGAKTNGDGDERPDREPDHRARQPEPPPPREAVRSGVGRHRRPQRHLGADRRDAAEDARPPRLRRRRRPRLVRAGAAPVSGSSD
jgi:hypothetical protein